jgi:5-methyltetrahydropteroyltriglutamate--homocysteine methyltransferase
LARAGATWVQMDEPCLVTDLNDEAKAAYDHAYRVLTDVTPPIRLMLTTYFGALGDNLGVALKLPVHGLHIDLIRARNNWPRSRRVRGRIRCCPWASSMAEMSGKPI